MTYTLNVRFITCTMKTCKTSPLLLEDDRRRDMNDLIILDPDSDRKSEPKML